MANSRIRRSRHGGAWPALVASAIALAQGGCLLGPDYQRPSNPLPQHFKEGADWQPASADPNGAISSTWWLSFGDPTLSALIEKSLQANQSIVSAEAAYRVALAQVLLARAGLFPLLGATASATRSKSAPEPSTGLAGGKSSAAIANVFEVGLQVSWEPDLWGSVRRTIEANADLAQASDAQLAGERLSIAAALATDYFLLRQADNDLDVLTDERKINEQVVAMTKDALSHGTASNDQLLQAENTLDGVIANVENELALRATYEHALAVLVNAAPAEFSLAAVPNYVFPIPVVPVSIPSVILQRRPDVTSAERTAASANASIGVAEAAFYPTLTLTASGGLVASTLPGLFSVPARVWSLGPSLAETIFDGGAHSAQLQIARATYDEEVAQYRFTVLTAFQNVEDSLAQVRYTKAQGDTLYKVYTRNQLLYKSILAQLAAGTASPEDVLTVQLALVSAKQNWADTESQVAQNTVALIKNLGGGWDGATGDASGASGPGTTSDIDDQGTVNSSAIAAPTIH